MRLFLFMMACLTAAPTMAKDITVTATPVPLNPTDPTQTSVGALEYVAGFALDSTAPEWGGYSGMVMAPDGSSLIAVSDVGHWIRLELKHDADGKLTGVGSARLEPLLDEAGKPVAGKEWSDAEEITQSADGQFFVSFERHHRIWRYASVDGLPHGAAHVVAVPDAIGSLPENSGIEAMIVTGGGNLWLLAEEAPDPVWGSRGWFGEGKDWTEYALERSGGFEPTAFGQSTPEVPALFLERRYTEADGPAARISMLSRSITKHHTRFAGFVLGVLARPLTVDNFEAMAVRNIGPGVLDIYLLSDDNQSDTQRTLLLQFRTQFD
jgi:hypothetical protein